MSSANHPDNIDLSQQDLKALFKLADRIGKKRYHKLTQQDFDNYRSYDYWRYFNGDGECGTTPESQVWVSEHSDYTCPICDKAFRDCGGRTIDHKLPRSQYPWLAMEFSNFWVICQTCNREKDDKHWYEYEHFIFMNYHDRYTNVQMARPRQLLKNLQHPSVAKD
jgi:HNH endonuclease